MHITTDIMEEKPDEVVRGERRTKFGRFVQTPQSLASNINWHHGVVSSRTRERLLRQTPATLWLTGLSGAGKSTLGYALEKLLLDRGHCCFVVDGDNLRHHLNCDLGFSPDDRRENIRRAAEVAHLINEAGMIAITAFISPFRADRAMAREIIGQERFVEVHISTPGVECERRDPKGLYARARRGEIPEFTGVSAPYEEPVDPDLVINSELYTIEEAAEILYRHLIGLCFVR
ncbi:adenylyl-sulfate kinase [Undibacterium sp. TS12]|uniref:adenylyl-sulfate kinase n=1 Tax=Undibacterium sp. TS12 TaxID=2908202 RepID=UPI001F4CB800|nr:adenylyl-sulfate kinase [Undibacterium sp. TS12]MCH8618370.1 adenylyl-sulfate kinase [Undibacterium sp. TS12]